MRFPRLSSACVWAPVKIHDTTSLHPCFCLFFTTHMLCIYAHEDFFFKVSHIWRYLPSCLDTIVCITIDSFRFLNGMKAPLLWAHIYKLTASNAEWDYIHIFCIIGLSSPVSFCYMYIMPETVSHNCKSHCMKFQCDIFCRWCLRPLIRQHSIVSFSASIQYTTLFISLPLIADHQLGQRQVANPSCTILGRARHFCCLTSSFTCQDTRPCSDIKINTRTFFGAGNMMWIINASKVKAAGVYADVI